MTGAAGVVLRLIAVNGPEDQDLFDGYIEDITQCQQVIRAGEGFTTLPFIDGLWGIETEVVLKVIDREAFLLPELPDVFACGGQVDHGEGLEGDHLNSSFLLSWWWIPGCPGS